jgi:hypothetical protein
MRSQTVWFLVMMLWLSWCGGCRPKGDAGTAVQYDVRISDGVIADYTYQALDRWKVDDEEGVRRIRELNPPPQDRYGSDVEWFHALRLWMREASRHGPGAFTVQFYPPLMLEKIRGDRDYSATCGPFSVAYAGLLLSYDVPVRLIHVYSSSQGKPLSSHTFTEVWSEHLQKWVAQDVDKNICWMDDRGTPMNAREVQDELVAGKDQARWRITPRRDTERPERSDVMDGELFHRLVIAFQSNYFHAGDEPYLAHQKGSLFHLARATETEENDPAWKTYKDNLSIRTVRDAKLVYAPVNQIVIGMTEQPKAYDFTLRNNILNFDHYEIRTGTGSWEALKDNGFSCRKKDLGQSQTVTVRGVSARGHVTGTATVRFTAR